MGLDFSELSANMALVVRAAHAVRKVPSVAVGDVGTNLDGVLDCFAVA